MPSRRSATMVKYEEEYYDNDETDSMEYFDSLPLPKRGHFPPSNYYVLCFWNLPPVKCLRTLRDELLDELKRSLPRGCRTTIRDKDVMVMERDEEADLWRKYEDDGGNPNVLINSYIFVPIRDIDEGQWLLEEWNNREYHGKQLRVFWSRYGRQPDN